MRTKLRNVVELHHRDVRNCVTSCPQTSWQVHAAVRDTFIVADWLFDFTHKHVAKMLSNLAFRGEIASRTTPCSGDRESAVYWRY